MKTNFKNLWKQNLELKPYIVPKYAPLTVLEKL